MKVLLSLLAVCGVAIAVSVPVRADNEKNDKNAVVHRHSNLIGKENKKLRNKS